MINPSFKELAEISPSRYDICCMIMKRARLITEGAEPLIETKSINPVSIALEEIMAGYVTHADGEFKSEN